MKEEILALHRRDKTPEQISGILEIPLTEVYEVLQAEGVKLRTAPKNPGGLTDDQVNALIKLYANEKIKTADLVAQFDITADTLYRILELKGIPKRTETSATSKEERITEALRLYQTTDSPLWAIQQITGVSPSTIAREIRKRNLPSRKEQKDLKETEEFAQRNAQPNTQPQLS